jgi:hypothetical protein
MTPAESATIATTYILDDSYDMWNPAAEVAWFQELRATPCKYGAVLIHSHTSLFRRYTQAGFDRTLGPLVRNIKGEKPVYARAVLKQLLGKSEAGTAAQQKAVLLVVRVCGCWSQLLVYRCSQSLST